MITVPAARQARVAALGLLLTLGACGGTPVPTATPTPQAATSTAPRPASAATTTAAPPASAVPPATATRAATIADTTMVPPIVGGSPSAATATRATAPATTVAPTATPVAPTPTPVATPRGYASGDPCAPYAAGAVPPLGRAVAAAPARLCIPALVLSAPIVPVGATAAGAMAEPPDPATVAWYAPGVPPGTPGNAALVGKVDVRAPGPGVFWSLDQLWAGDVLIVVDAAGVARRFMIDENAVYPATDAPVARIFGPADDANLSLVTGAGTWDPTVGAYDGIRVVHARMAP